jgi:hypothetical protein
MTDPVCIREPSAKSILPGNQTDADATYCLLKYGDFDCGCITKVETVELKQGVEPECVIMSDDTYFSYRWMRTCAANVSNFLRAKARQTLIVSAYLS